MRALLISAFAFGALAACGQTTTTTTVTEEPVAEAPVATPATAEEATAQDTCGASGYASMIGTNIAAVTLPTTVRVIAPDTVVTMDFRADRVNIRTDAQGVITAVDCG